MGVVVQRFSFDAADLHADGDGDVGITVAQHYLDADRGVGSISMSQRRSVNRPLRPMAREGKNHMEEESLSKRPPHATNMSFCTRTEFWRGLTIQLYTATLVSLGALASFGSTLRGLKECPRLVK